MTHNSRLAIRISWKQGTRALVIGVTMLTVVIVAIIRHGGGGSAGHLTPRPAPAESCYVSTAQVTPITICREP